jgi:hypothetical protein
VERLRPVEFIKGYIVAYAVVFRDVAGALPEAEASGDLRQMDLVVPFVPGGLDTRINLGVDDEDVL